MSGDYTRFTHAPRKRFAGVLLQQGRVQLDSDWNEANEIERERVRLLGLDSGGSAWVAAPTPDAFLVGAITGVPADFALGEGRLYVDGRLAQIFAGEGVTYLNQPFLPSPPPLNASVDKIVYLELWEREVTWAEDEALLDVALGGLDTATRIQQVWQVKAIDLPGGGATCGADLDALFSPSGGRLTTSATAPPTPDDPCVLPPAAGYRGIENRLYRIEVQVGGALGAAKFKWSRDNGSIVSRVSALAVAGGETRVTVNRLGRDAFDRFRVDDWVTLTDDHREFHGEAGQMARIKDIVRASNVIVLDRAAPGAGRAFGADAAQLASRHTRLQRWDQKGPTNALDGDGLMTVAAGPIALEDGVLASFSIAAGGQFQIGDHWVFAARTATASVEPLSQAAPRGIRRQRVQLAAIASNSPPVDCRPKPAQNGCCTFVVRPGEDIQAAIDALPPEGGCVCLKAGVHFVERPIIIAGAHVTLHGESLGAIVESKTGAGVLAVYGGARNRLQSLTLRQTTERGGPVLALMRSQDCAVHDCRIEAGGDAGTIGVAIMASEGATVTGCAVSNAALGIDCAEGCQDIEISGCEIVMPRSDGRASRTIGIWARNMTGSITVAQCEIGGATDGIVVNDEVKGFPASDAEQSRISGNRLRLIRATRDGGGAALSWGIDMAAGDALVESNHIHHEGGRIAAIRLGGSGSQARGNQVVSAAKVPEFAVAIAIGYEADGKALPLERIAVCDNHARGPQHGVVALNVSRARISGNVIGQAATEIGIGVLVNNCDDSVVAENAIDEAVVGIMIYAGARNSLVANRIERGMVGVAAFGEVDLAVRGCEVHRATLAGIAMVLMGGQCDIVENRVIRCGGGGGATGALSTGTVGTLPGLGDFGVGIGAAGVWGHWHVESNAVVDTGIATDGGKGAALAVGIWGEFIREARVESNQAIYSGEGPRPLEAEDRSLVLSGAFEFATNLAGEQQIIGFPAQIASNNFVGVGRTALVEVRAYEFTDNLRMRFEWLMFTGNFCSHYSNRLDDRFPSAATVQLHSGRLTVGNNQVKALSSKFPSYNLFNRPGPFFGNVSRGPTIGRAPANEFPAPQSAFNQIG